MFDPNSTLSAIVKDIVETNLLSLEDLGLIVLCRVHTKSDTETIQMIENLVQEDNIDDPKALKEILDRHISINDEELDELYLIIENQINQ